MLDLRASINVMPASTYRSLNFEDLEPTGMTIQLANRSIVQPLGVLEDVLVQVNELIFPADFYVLDMEDKTSGKGSTLILGRPFLMTARTKINVHAGTLSMEFGDTLVQFNIFEAMKHPTEDHSLFGIDIMEELVEEYFQLDSCSAKVEDCAELTESISCSKTDHDEVQEFLDSKDDHSNVSDLAFERELIELINQVYYPKTSKSMNNAEVKVAETKKPLPAQLATIFTTDPRPITEESPSLPPVELKPLPNHLKYAYLDIIIVNNLLLEQEEKLLKVLRQHKKAIGWKLSDLPGINPSICMHRILMEEDIKPIRKQQRRLNPTILDVVKKKVTKLLATGIIYPISDSQWVSPVQVVPKKSGMTVMKNQQDELVPMRIQNSWRVCIDYRRLNQATRKDHFPLPFIDQMLEKIAGKSHYCFLDGFSGYMQIHIAPEDQHKTTFTCPFGTFAYTRMPFGLCNAPSTFQRCMMSIFSDLLQDCMEVFMDDFTVYAESFDACLNNLSKVLKRCTDTNLVLNFEKCHFMVTEGIVLGHLVSNRGIEVDKAKIDVITSLPNPTSVRKVRSFLGHAGFYRRFIKDFSKLALPLSTLLQKDVEFNFDQPCIEAFQELKSRLTSAPILQAPNWDLPFELMCYPSNSALGAVLGQRVGVGQPTHQNYTKTEKELLEIVFALDKFRSYILSSKIVVFSDHAALRYLLKKPDTKMRLIRWMLLLQEFDLKIRDKKGDENSIANHLSRIERESEQLPIRDEFPDEHLLHIKSDPPWYADICNFVATSQFPPTASRTYKEKIRSDAKYYVWDDPYLWRLCSDKIIHKCIPDTKINSVLQFCLWPLEEGITDHLGLPGKCWTVAFTGHLFSETLINSSPPAKMLESRDGLEPKT
ncbi:Retrovirus-related Pol polyprotein, partial [Mucuna pruriens]